MYGYIFSTTSFVLLNFAVVAWTLQQQLKATAYSCQLSQWRWRQLCGRAELGACHWQQSEQSSYHWYSLNTLHRIHTYIRTCVRTHTYIHNRTHSCILRQWTVGRRRDHKGRDKEDQGEAFVRVRKRQRRSNAKAKRKADRQTTKKKKSKGFAFHLPSLTVQARVDCCHRSKAMWWIYQCSTALLQLWWEKRQANKIKAGRWGGCWATVLRIKVPQVPRMESKWTLEDTSEG